MSVGINVNTALSFTSWLIFTLLFSQKTSYYIILAHSSDCSCYVGVFRGSSCSHRPPSARRTSWGRRRTLLLPSSGFTPGVSRNLSRVNATTTRSSTMANFWPMQFLLKYTCYFATKTFPSCTVGNNSETEPGAWGEGDEGMRGLALFVAWVKSLGIIFLVREQMTKIKYDRFVSKIKMILLSAYMWVCPNSGVMVCSINAYQADCTWFTRNN